MTKTSTESNDKNVHLSAGEIETIKVALMTLLADISDSGFGDDDIGIMQANAHKQNVSIILNKINL